MRAYKFLAQGRIGPFTDFAWPLSEWVAGTTRPCGSGIHACDPEDLPYWIDHELWLVQLDGPIVRGAHKMAAPRGRLIERVEAWNAKSAQDFADACLEHARGQIVKLLDREIARAIAEAPRAALAGTLPAPGVDGACDRLRDVVGCWSKGSLPATGYVAACACGTREGYVDARRVQGEWFASLLR